MVEPLNESTSQSSFTGKAHNKHPHWHNVPLRLSEEQKQNPVLVLNEFFESFHLNEVREIMWAWMVEVVSSPHSISQDANERSNHVFFYEKMEEVVEACWIIRKKVLKYMRKKKHKKSRHRPEVKIMILNDDDSQEG